MMIKPSSVRFLVLSACLLFATPLWAGEQSKGEVVDIIPAHTATGETEASFTPSEATHPILRLTPDKSELIYLDTDAASIVVGNPLHANVMADSMRTLVVVPRLPGATYFTVLDKDGKVIMQRHIIVGSPKENYVRVKKVCNSDAKNCQSTSVFYCPDMCHEIGSGLVKESGDESGAETQEAEETTEPYKAAEPAAETATENNTSEETQ